MDNLTFPAQSPEILAIPFKSNAGLLFLKLQYKPQTWLLNIETYAHKMNQQQALIHDVITQETWQSKHNQILRLFKYTGLF